MMAARTVLRRITHFGQRLQMRGLVHLSHHLSAGRLMLARDIQATTAQRYSQIRSLASVASTDVIINIQDEADFQKRVINSAVPVIVDFHASWCGPCKLLGPRLESIVVGQKGKVVLARVDVDDHSELAMQYGISSIPTVIGVKDKQAQGQFIGLQEDDRIRTFIEKLL